MSLLARIETCHRYDLSKFRPFLAAPVWSVTGRFVPVAEVYGAAGRELSERILGADDAHAVQIMDDFLAGFGPRRDADADLVARVVDRAAADPSIARVDQLARAAGVGRTGVVWAVLGSVKRRARRAGAHDPRAGSLHPSRTVRRPPEIRAPQEPDGEGIQVLRLRYDVAAGARHHLRGGAERFRQVQRRRRHRVGAR